MHLILKSRHTTGIIPVCFPLKSESSPFVYLRNSNTTGQPTDSIILACCKYQEEINKKVQVPPHFHVSTARCFWSFLNTVVIIRIVLLLATVALFLSTREGIIVDASHPQRYTDVIRSMSIFQREKREKCFHPAD